MYNKSLTANNNMDLLCRETVILNDCEINTTTINSHNNNDITLYEDNNNKEKLHHHHNEQEYHHHYNHFNNNDDVLIACRDPIFMHDRCLENLLKAEEKYTTVCSYFTTVQTEITPPMRKIVAEWMLEVCQERNCQEEVFLLALNYMDRFLTSTAIQKTHLQLLAAACLLMASKLREPSSCGLPIDSLIYYTDNSVSKVDLIDMELIVLGRLKWDVSSVTPLDFLELLLTRLSIICEKCPHINLTKVRRHTHAFISLAAREHHFSIYSASTIAASSIAAALCDMKWHLQSKVPISHLLDRLTDLTGVEQDYLSTCMKKMEELLDNHRKRLKSNNKVVEQPQSPEKGKYLAETPTDVQDVEF